MFRLALATSLMLNLCFGSDIFNLINQLSQMKTSEILDCNTVKALKTARDTEGFTKIFDLKNPEQMKNFYEFKFYHSTIFLNLQCNESRAVLEEISRRNLFNASRYFVLHGTEKLDEAQEFLNGQNIKINSKIQILIGDQLYEATSPELWAGSKLSINFVKNFSSTEVDQKMKRKAFDLEGITATAVITQTPPGKVFLEYIHGHDSSHRDSSSRWGVPIVKLLAELWNFKVHWIRTTSSGHMLADNETLDGVIGAYQKGIGNLSAGFVTYVSPRIPYMDSGFSVAHIREMFIFRHPKHDRGVKSQRNVFLRPLSDGVWMCLGIISVLSMAVLYLIYRYERRDSPGIMATTNIVSILSQQDVSVDSMASFKSRTIVLIFFAATFICWQYYTASIVGSLLNPPPRSVNNLCALADSGLKIVLETGNVSIGLLRIWRNDDIAPVYEKKIKGMETFVSLDEGLALVQRGGYAFFTFVDYSYDLIKERFSATEIDELQEIPMWKQKLKSFLYFPVPKFSAYKELVRVGVLRTIEVGLASYWEKRWTSKQPLGNLDKITFAEVDFLRFSTCFYMLCVGMLISLLIFVGEVIHKRVMIQRMEQVTLFQA